MNHWLNFIIDLAILIVVLTAVCAKQIGKKALFGILIVIAAIAQLAVLFWQKQNLLNIFLGLLVFVFTCFLADFIVAELRERRAKRK